MATPDERLMRDALEFRGNWTQWSNFALFHKEEFDGGAENWGIWYTSTRDSRLLEESNAGQIAEALKPYLDADDPNIVTFSSTHWAVGHVDGWAIRPIVNGEVTGPFRTAWELKERLADYPILDEEDYSRREYEATLANIEQEGGYLARRLDIDLPDGWESSVYSWLSENNQRALENVDDQGGYPTKEDIQAAFVGLGYYEIPQDEEEQP